MLRRSAQLGFSMMELMIVIVVVMIVAALAIPNLLAARRAANEASAVSSLRNYHSAQATYQSTTGAGNFAGDQTGATNGFSVLAAANLLDTELGSGTKSGYFFVGASIQRTASNPASFVGVAYPSTFGFPSGPAPLSVVGEAGHTGSRVFVVGTDGIIHWESITGLSSPSELTLRVEVTNNAFNITGGAILAQ